MLTDVYRMGSPKDLFMDRGAFYEMVQHSGEAEELEAMFAAPEE